MPDIPMHIITTVLLETGMYLSAEHFGRSLSLALEAVFKSAGWSSNIPYQVWILCNKIPSKFERLSELDRD